MQSHLQAEKKDEVKHLNFNQIITQMVGNKVKNESEKNYLVEAYLSDNEGLVHHYKIYCKTKQRNKFEERI